LGTSRRASTITQASRQRTTRAWSCFTQAPDGGFTLRLHVRPLGYGQRVPVVPFCLWTAEVAGDVAENLGRWPKRRQRLGPRRLCGERQQCPVSGFGALAVIDGDGEQAADAGPEQPEEIVGGRERPSGSAG
jgi:hypothetical protein